MKTQGPRERLVTSAITLVRERGVDATGIAELLDHSKTARGSIYQHFPGGKSELVTVSTKVAGEQRCREIRQLAESGDVAALIQGLVAYLGAELTETDFRLGCPIIAAAVASPDAIGVRAAAAEVYTTWVDELAVALKRGGRTDENVQALAGFMVDGIEGAYLRARCSRSVEPLIQAGRHLTALLAAAA